MSNIITRIAIAGHGFEAWFTANHLLAGLGKNNIEITVCPVTGSDALDRLYTILPSASDDGLANIGLADNLLVRQCRASFSLGTEVNNQLKPYGKLGLDFLGLSFHHHWLRTGTEAADYFSWSPGLPAMQRGAFAPPVSRNAIGDLQHGTARHVDVPLLTHLLRDRARHNGVNAIESAVAKVVRREDNGRVSQLLTGQGETIEADLYVDCSGTQRILADGLEPTGWAAAPGTTVFNVKIEQHEQAGAVLPFHRVAPQEDGWGIEIPGNGWTTEIALNSNLKTDDATVFTPGHLERPWNGNCVAVGCAAALFLPVEPVQARFLSISLKRMLDLLPGSNCTPCETAEYNHLAVQDAMEIEDLGAVWELARMTRLFNIGETNIEQAHESLRHRLLLFRRRGWISPADSGFFEKKDWASALILLGLLPERHDVLAERLPFDRLESYLQKLKTQITNTAAEFPPHNAYLDAIKSAARTAQQRT